jgi:hypothetical protein
VGRTPDALQLAGDLPEQGHYALGDIRNICPLVYFFVRRTEQTAVFRHQAPTPAAHKYLIIQLPADGIAGRRPDVNSPPPSTINSAAECPLERS